MNDAVHAVAALIRSSQRIAVLTGAGVSKESGVPTFRDALDGLWARYDPQELATVDAFRRNPKLVWDWYTYRREMVHGAQPNPGHLALAQLAERVPALTLITQNVDNLHERAGSRDVIHLHGNIARSKCFGNCQGVPTPVDETLFAWDRDSGPPPCPHCGGPVRPDVVWFGEMLPQDRLEAALAASTNCDLMLVVGTSGLVTPAASLPSYARRAGATVVEINPDRTPISQIATHHLAGPSGEMLPCVMEALHEAS
jgi:NAD-dependent deacetylase